VWTLVDATVAAGRETERKRAVAGRIHAIGGGRHQREAFRIRVISAMLRCGSRGPSKLLWPVFPGLSSSGRPRFQNEP
jgi:hypothetical protein